jgi:hypothetical protein
MSNDDDTSWLDALAGRIDSDTATREPALEAQVLRKFIQAEESQVQDVAAVADVPIRSDARERELLDRARAEGLLPNENAPRRTAAAASRGRRRWFADNRIKYVAAALVLVTASVGVWRSTLPPIETLRGTINGTVHLEARDPPELKRQLIEELNAAGVQVTGYERLGHIGIDAELPLPVSAPVAAILDRHHIPVPADGVLAVEIDSPRRR